MKKLITMTLIVLVGMIGYSQSTLPNGDFEDWYFSSHPSHPQGGWYEPDGGFFFTLNILDTIPTPPGLTCYRTDTVNSGDWAARVITREISVLQILIPGVVGTIKINWATSGAILGSPYIWSTKPERFQGYYKSYPLNNDSSAAVILLSKWNTGSHKRDTIAYNRIVFKGIVDTYTKFDSAITYYDQTTLPDSITVLLLSCAGFNAVNMMGSVGQVGSQALFDDVTLTNISGIDYQLMPEVGVRLYPNPAGDIMTIELSKKVNDGTLEIFTIDGKHITDFAFKQIRSSLQLNSLSDGTYYFKLKDGNRIVNTGSFIIKR